MWDELGISPCDDTKTIRRAYAARLKKLDLDNDPVAFARLREAFEWALAEIGDETPPRLQPSRARSPEPDTDHDDWNGPDPLPPTGEASRDAVVGGSDEPAAGDDGAAPEPEWLDLSISERSLLEAFNAALERRDTKAALALFHRALLPLQDALAQLDTLFALLLDDTTVEPAAFREFARTFGWDRPALEDGTLSELRQRVLARLAAEDWYDALVAAAASRAKVPRKQARASRNKRKVARLMLRKIGRYRLPRVDSAELKACLEQFSIHQAWLRDRIDPAWAIAVEKRWRRREIFRVAFFVLLLSAMLLNGIRVLVLEPIDGTLPLSTTAVAPFAAAFLLWILKLLVAELYRLIKKKPFIVIDPKAGSGDQFDVPAAASEP